MRLLWAIFSKSNSLSRLARRWQPTFSVYIVTIDGFLASRSLQKMNRQTTSPERSAVMRAVKGKDTRPELQVRRLIHSLGYRFRLHRSDLPGTPDIVLPKLQSVIFVHGCFWHGHNCPRGSRRPKSNAQYWQEKIAGNSERDQINQRRLRALGWRLIVVWECELHTKERATQRRLTKFLERAERSISAT